MPEPEIATPLPVRNVKSRRRRLQRWTIALVALGAWVLAGWLIGRHIYAARQVRAAEQALREGDFADALNHLEQALYIGQDSASLHLQAARAARRAEQYERAEEHLALCEKKGDRLETALERLMLRAQQGDLADTELPLQRQINDTNPDSVLLLEALARGYLKAMRMGKAHETLTRLIELDPDHPWAHFWRGGLYETLHRTSEALPDFRRAVELAPRQGEFRLRLALAQLDAGQTAKAGPHFDDLLQQMPRDPRVLLGVARYHRASARPERALEYLDTLLRDHPDNAEGWAQRGRAYRDQGNSTEAVRCLRKSFELEPRSYAVGFDLYTELYALGQIKEAKAIEQRVEHQKQQEKLVERLLIRLENDRKSASLRYEIGMVYFRNELNEMALNWFRSALQVDPDHRPTHEALADYYQRQGDKQKARFHRQRAGTAKP